MSLETMMIISVVVATVGTLSAQSLRRSGSPYLLIVTGSRMHLMLAGGMIWFAALALGLVALLAVSLVMPSVVAIALFFGIEAVALDMCAHRVRYERVDSLQTSEARISVTHR